jgi:hypothetical protein
MSLAESVSSRMERVVEGWGAREGRGERGESREESGRQSTQGNVRGRLDVEKEREDGLCVCVLDV